VRFNPILPNTAINLFQALLTARGRQLQPALDQAAQVVGVLSIDAELHRLVPTPTLNYLASLNLRGERVFPVPSIIRHAPQLIGYYRMLLGISKKDFSQANKLGYGTWANAEAQETISARLDPYVEDFCKALIAPLVELVDATKLLKPLDDHDLNDLALLTLGPTLQGGRNNVIGQQAAKDVFDALHDLVRPWIRLDTDALIQFQTPAGTVYELAVGSDPDIRLDEVILVPRGAATRRPIVAMEIKGGRDISNAHNRAGEAEKSHLKAKEQGYQERWTIMEMRGLDWNQIRAETPSSTEVFDAAEVRQRSGTSWENPKRKLSVVVGIATP
jgi:XcyI restriction endonuclease